MDQDPLNLLPHTHTHAVFHADSAAHPNAT